VEIGAAVADVGDHQIGAVPQGHHDGGAHAVALGRSLGVDDFWLAERMASLACSSR